MTDRDNLDLRLLEDDETWRQAALLPDQLLSPLDKDWQSDGMLG